MGATLGTKNNKILQYLYQTPEGALPYTKPASQLEEEELLRVFCSHGSDEGAKAEISI